MRGHSPEAMWFAFFSPSVRRGRSGASSGMLTGTWDGLREVGIVPNLLCVQGRGAGPEPRYLDVGGADRVTAQQTDQQTGTDKQNERLLANGWLRARHDR